MKTVYLAVEVSDDEFERAVDELYVSDSVLTRRLEMVLQARFGAVVEPVRNAVMLKIADAQQALDALEERTPGVTGPGFVALETEDEQWDAQAIRALSGALWVVQRHGG